MVPGVSAIKEVDYNIGGPHSYLELDLYPFIVGLIPLDC